MQADSRILRFRSSGTARGLRPPTLLPSCFVSDESARDRGSAKPLCIKGQPMIQTNAVVPSLRTKAGRTQEIFGAAELRHAASRSFDGRDDRIGRGHALLYAHELRKHD